MLKLEKASREQISITMRDKERLFTRPLAIAFAIALGYHLLFLILFHVVPLKLHVSQTIFPPVQVEIDGNQEVAVLANIDSQQMYSSGLPERNPVLPALPSRPSYSEERFLEYFQEQARNWNPFQQLEQSVYQPEFMPLVHDVVPPIRILISGPLSEIELVDDGIDKVFPTLRGNSQQNEWKVSYHVMVKEQTGRVFWFEPVIQTHIQAIDHFAEQVLRDLRFNPMKDAFVTAGDIELMFTLGQRP